MGIPLNLENDTNEGVHHYTRFCSLRKLIMILEKALMKAKEGGIFSMGEEAK